MIDIKTLLPMVKRLLPNEQDADLIAGIKEFAQAHPDLGNKEALQALIMALKDMQGGGQPQQQPAAPAPAKPFGEGLMGALGSK